MPRLTRLLLVYALLLTPSPAETARDFYPEVRKILLEVETAAAGIAVLPDRGEPLPWAARLFARAGYLDDAARVLTKAGRGQEQIASARVLYGDLPGGLQAVGAVRDAERRVMFFTGIAHVLWEMGDRSNAQTLLDQAERLLPTIANPAHRKVQAGMVSTLKDALPDEPPRRLSSKPDPKPRPPAPSSIPSFPITVDGYRDVPPEVVTRRALENEDYLTQMYALIAAGDRQALEKHTAGASSIFQKTLGLASIEHLLIQLGATAEAEQYARAIPDDGADCSLAKVEALSAAAVAWGHKGTDERARQCFNDALTNVSSVARDLAFGKAVVTGAIAAAQADAGLIATSQATFDLALKLVSEVAPRPRPVNGVYPKTYSWLHFQDDAYRAIFASQIRAHDLGSARRTANLWRRAAGRDANTSIIMAWFAAGQRDDALSYARSLKDLTERVPALLVVADSLLDEAGAPVCVRRRILGALHVQRHHNSDSIDSVWVIDSGCLTDLGESTRGG